MGFFKSRFFVGLFCLSIGFFVGYWIGFDRSERALFSLNVDPFSSMPGFNVDIKDLEQNLFGQLEDLKAFKGYGSQLGGITFREDKENYYYEVEAAGVDEKSIEVKLENGVLTIQGEKRIEGSFGTSISQYVRSFPIGEDIDINSAEINYESNKIIVKVPKRTL